MSSDKLQKYSEFEESVKSKINIAELYTKLTGEEFVKVKGRLRAKVKWRQDEHESLTWVPDKNILTDFTEETETGKGGNYNPIDVMMRVGGALGRRHALQKLCELTNTEFPSEFNTLKDQDGNLGNLGKALNLVFQESLNRRDFLFNNKNKIPASLIDFFEKRNIPFDLEFLKAMNIGICPIYDVVKGIWAENKIPFIKKSNDKQGENSGICIFPEMQDTAIVFPLHNEYGALAGLKFRDTKIKTFTEWISPSKNCYYNLNKFIHRKSDRLAMIVEGEMNLIAYAISAWKYLEGSENKNEELQSALSLIFATGSKNTTLTSLKGEIKKCLYIPDYDIKDSTIENIKTHPIIHTSTKISKQIDAIELNIVDWSKIPGVHEKYDLEDYLKSNNYSLSKFNELKQVSLPRYCLDIIKTYCGNIHNSENERIAQISLVSSIADKLSFAQRKVFEEIAAKEFDLSKEVVDSIEENNLDATYGDFLIHSGGIAKKVQLEEDKFFLVPMTNFYCKLKEETIVYNCYSHKTDKSYTVDILVGSDIRSGVASPSDLSDTQKFKVFLNSHHSFDKLKYLDPEFDAKTNVILHLMKNIGKPVQKLIFTSMGRPQESVNYKKFKTDLFCLLPKVSVINGNVIKNENFEIQLLGVEEGDEENESRQAGSKYCFQILNNEETILANNIFWNHLRKLHDENLMASMIALALDSCTPELHGDGIVPDHGFTFYLDGVSGTKKTTSVCALMSLLGGFKDQSDLFSFHSTSLSLEHRLIGVGNLLAPIDELKNEIVKSSEITNLFNAVYGGTTKARSGSNMSQKGGVGLQCSVLITAESSPEDIPESIASRVIIVRIPKVEDEINKERKEHLDKFNEYRHLMNGFMPLLIAWCHKKGPAFYSELLLKWKLEFKRIVERFDNHERIVDMIARLITGYDMVCKYVVENGITNKEEADSSFENFVLYWKKEIRTQIKRVRAHSSTSQNIKLLAELIDSGTLMPHVFKNNRWQISSNRNGSPVADVTYEDGSRKLLILGPSILMKSFDNMVDVKSLYHKFKNDMIEEGLMDKQPNGDVKQYPKPDMSNGKISERSSKHDAIDYEKFLLVRKTEGFND